MKKFLVPIMIVLFALTSQGALTPDSTANAETILVSQKKDDKKGKKNPPGPPVVRGKEPKDSGQGNKPPKKNKKP